MRYSSKNPFWACMIVAAVLLLNTAEATVFDVPSSHACQERIDTELNDGSLSKRACHQPQPQGQQQRRSDPTVDISSSVSVGSSSSSVSIGDEGDNEPPRGGAGGTEAMAVVKAASMTSEVMSHGGGGGIYHGGHSKAHMGRSSSVSSSAGERKLRQRAARNGRVVVGAVLWAAAVFL
ncbi:hypothetical protein F5H01DRAFT_343086 [Linnemannia elongata]|nr:hypothetical protein F5H01DRAFT_343086 [Linnemannia elongata]